MVRAAESSIGTTALDSTRYISRNLTEVLIGVAVQPTRMLSQRSFDFFL
jgi:hypothetical protein